MLMVIPKKKKKMFPHIIIPSLCQLSHLPFYGPSFTYPPLELWYLEYENLWAISCCYSIHVLSHDALFDWRSSLSVVDAARASYLLRWGFFLKTDCTTNVLLVFMPSPFQTPEWLDQEHSAPVFFFCWGGEGVRCLHGELNAKVNCKVTIVTLQLGRGKWWSTMQKKTTHKYLYRVNYLSLHPSPNSLKEIQNGVKDHLLLVSELPTCIS